MGTAWLRACAQGRASGQKAVASGWVASVIPSLSRCLPHQQSLQMRCLVMGVEGGDRAQSQRTQRLWAAEQCECPWEFKGLQGELARQASPNPLYPVCHEGPEGATAVSGNRPPQDLSQGAEQPVASASVPCSP